MTFTTRALAAPVAVPAAYAAAAKAKLKRDRESFAAFRRVDQEEHDRAHGRRVAAAVAAAEEEVRLWRLELAEREPEAAEALAGFRAAEDRAREARAYARQQLAAYELVRGKGSAAEETEARIRADAADETAANAAKVMEEKQAGLTGADQLLAEAREGLAGAERQLEKAGEAAEVPAGPAPISDVTVKANASHMQCDEVWDSLSKADRQRVQHMGEPRDLMSAQEFAAMMREALAIGGYRGMSGMKKLRKKLGKKVIAGKLTVDEARARLGRQMAQDRRPRREEQVSRGLEAAAALIKSARPVTHQDLLNAAAPMTRPPVTKAAGPAPREHPLQVLKGLKNWQSPLDVPAAPPRSWTPAELATLREAEKLSDPASREGIRKA